ncbi:hypothetical protein Aph02nite_74260 [Actinoplanes philippinensis]|nr:hypothetical protein Aph02nite_74260 [Actinoplanes philippinensis]
MEEVGRLVGEDVVDGADLVAGAVVDGRAVLEDEVRHRSAEILWCGVLRHVVALPRIRGDSAERGNIIFSDYRI